MSLQQPIKQHLIVMADFIHHIFERGIYGEVREDVKYLLKILLFISFGFFLLCKKTYSNVLGKQF